MTTTTKTRSTQEPTLFDVAEDEDVDLVPASTATALMVPRGDQSPLAALAEMEHGLKVMERRAQILDDIRRAALRITDPRDWVQAKGKNDEATEAVCLLTNSGARKIAPYYGITVHNVRPASQGVPEPVQEKGEEGEVTFTLWADIFVGLTREEAIGVRASRSTSEQFIGRGGLDTTSALVAKGDIVNAVYTLLFSKAVRIGAGMKNVPVRELAEAWKGTDKKVDSIPRGSGFGTSSQRGASSVTSDDIKAEQEKLRAEILRRVGGSEEDAKALLKDITLWTGKDGKDRYSTHVSQITKEYPLKKAWEALEKHPTFGGKFDRGNGGGE